MRPGTPSRRLLAYTALQTALVAVLAGVAAAFLRFTPFGLRLYGFAPGPSGPAAVATMGVVRAAFVALAALSVLVPVALGWYLVTRVAAREAAAGPAEPRTPIVLVLALAALLVAGAGFGGVLVGPTAGLVTETSPSPTTSWSYEYEPAGDGRGLLTVTFDRGRAVWADHLSVRGSGFADVPGADRTGPGPWTGTPAGGTVAVGDSTTVGVRSDCEVRLVYEFGERVEAIGAYECPGQGEGTLSGPPLLGGGS